MASMKITSFSILILITLGFSAQYAIARHQHLIGISPFCKPSDNLRLCNRMINGASNLHDASVNAINTAIYVAKRIQTLVPLIVTAVSDLPPTTRDDLIKVCADSFDNAVDDLQKALDAFVNGDSGGADTNLSAAFRTECTDALKQEGESVPLLTKLNDQFFKVVDNALAVVFQRYADQMWGGSGLP